MVKKKKAAARRRDDVSAALPSSTILRIAAEAEVDPRTVRRALDGGASPLARRAVERACQTLGIKVPS